MTALVVFESMFGSTAAVAQAVAEGLATRTTVRTVEVGRLVAEGGAVPDDVTLLVVGGPTHAFSMSRASTREDAAREVPRPLVSPGPGLREWLADVALREGLPVAAFDTKVVRPNLPGSAARAAERALRHQGGRPVVPAHSFKVNGKADGLVDGQLEEARRWGRDLAVVAQPV